MTDSTTEQRDAKSLLPTREAAPVAAPPESQAVVRSSAGHGGVYSQFRRLTASNDGQEPPPERFSPLFRRADYAHPVNEAQKGRMLGALQQQFGNRYVQRVLAPAAGETGSPLVKPVQRQAAAGATDPSGTATESLIERSSGHSLDTGTRHSMEPHFGHDFSGVRVHTDSSAQQAARHLGAEAFTSGRDLYFSPGAYNPASEQGRGLLAHELTHVVQQDRGMASASPQGFRVSQPTDPLERQAEGVRAAFIRGEMLPPIGAAPAGGFYRQVGARPGAAPAPAAPSAPAPATGGPAAAPAAAKPGDIPLSFAGMTVVLPVGKLLDKAAPGGEFPVPDSVLKKVPSLPAFKLTGASLKLDDNKLPTGGTVDLSLAIAPVEGQGNLTLDKQGNASGSVHAVFRSNKIPGLKETAIDAKVGKDDFAFDANLDFDLPKVTGALNYKYQGKKHSGKGKANYEGAKLKGSLEIIMSEAGRISGSGTLDMELFKGLKGQVEVAVDEKRDIRVKGKLSVPGQIELFPEKKYEKSFFSFEKKFPIWGITIPVIDVNVGIFAEIHAGAGFRAKFGPGVLRDITLTGEFGTDPEAATEFGLGGEFFVPAGAEIVVNVGGGIGLGLAIADITGGIEAVGVAGLYTALTVRP